MSTDQSNYIRIIQSFLPMGGDSGSIGPDAKKLREELAQIAGATNTTPKASSESPVAQTAVDLLDFEGSSAKPQDVIVAPKTQDTMDLMGLEESTSTVEQAPQLIPAPEADLLGSLESLPAAAPQPSPQVGGLDLFDAPSSSPQASFNASVAPPQQAKPSELDGLQSRLGDLFNMPAAQQQQQVPAPMMPTAVQSGGYAGMPSGGTHTAGMMPNVQQPVMQQAEGPIIGMTQIKPPKKDEPKDPFAGLAGF